jgi:hypothetical protein
MRATGSKGVCELAKLQGRKVYNTTPPDRCSTASVHRKGHVHSANVLPSSISLLAEAGYPPHVVGDSAEYSAYRNPLEW